MHILNYFVNKFQSENCIKVYVHEEKITNERRYIQTLQYYVW